MSSRDLRYLVDKNEIQEKQLELIIYERRLDLQRMTQQFGDRGGTFGERLLTALKFELDSLETALSLRQSINKTLNEVLTQLKDQKASKT